MQTDTRTNSDAYLDCVKAMDMSDEAKAKVAQDIEQYDRAILDGLTSPAVLTLSDYGSMSIRSASSFAHDPYMAKWVAQGMKGYRFLTFADGIFTEATGEEAGAFLYIHAKALGSVEVPQFNNVSGAIIPWDVFVGSIPGHMRDYMEAVVYNEFMGAWEYPAKTCLHECYQREVEMLLCYMRAQVKRVEIRNGEESKWETVPITKLKVWFGRFDSVSEQSTQTTAYFCVEDMSPEFDPPSHWNMHGQYDARVLYNGAIAIDCRDGKVSVSSHH